MNGVERADGLGLGVAVGGDAVFGAFGSVTGGTMPLRKTRVLPAGTSTAAEIGKVLPFGSLWRITSSAGEGAGTQKQGQRTA